MTCRTCTLTVTVELDNVPGVFHTPESAQEVVQALLERSILHYNPRVLITDSPLI